MTYNRPVCNCPDAANEAKKNFFSSYFSDTFDRNWKTKVDVEGAISSFNGIRNRGFYCKHELAVIRVRDEIKEAFPNGIPYEPIIENINLQDFQYRQTFDSDFLNIPTIGEALDDV